MTRINAGSTLANQYAPPFVVSDSVTTNWQLRYNATLLAFEAFDPSENVIVAGFDVIESQLFSSVVSQQQFVVPWVAASEESLYVTVAGIKRHTNEYSITTDTASNTTTITLTVAATGDVEVVGLQTTGGATIDLFTDVGDGGTVAFVLSWLAPSEQSLLITFDGIKQDTTSYSIASNATFTITTVTFVAAPGAGVEIEIVGITTTGEIPASPVQVANLGSGEGLFASKTLSGETQIFNFKSIAAGTSITLTDNTTFVTIDADATTFANLGSGAEVISPNATTVDFGASETLDFHTLNGGNGITLVLAGGELTWSIDHAYVDAGATPYIALVTDRIIAISGLPGAFAITLIDPTTLTVGDTITVKNQTAGTSAITLTPAAGLIDGSPTYVISSAFGYVTFYSDGSDYFVISAG